MSIGKNIKALRTFYGETLEELQLAIDLESKSTISNYENDPSKIPERDILIKIAEHYNITVDELINDDLSNENNIKAKDVMNLIGYKSFSELLPFLYTKDAYKNIHFNNACEILKQFNKNNSKNEIIEMIKKASLEYYKALNEGIIEAKINLISLLIYYVAIIRGDMFESIIDLLNNRISLNDFIKKSLVDSDIKKKDNAVDNSIIDFIEQLILDLRKDKEYEELSDYFNALKYLFGAVSNDNNIGMNKKIGSEMMMNLGNVGNKYAINYFKLNVKIFQNNKKML